jgi:hypothetical protein
MEFETFAQFLYRECGVDGYESWDELGEQDRNIWRAEYCRHSSDLLDALSYIESQQLSAHLAAVFVSKEGGVNSARNTLTAHAALGKLMADLIVTKADEAGDYYVHEACLNGYFSDRSR